MTLNLNPIDINTDKWRTLVERVNEIVNDLNSKVVTTGNTAIGNISLNGILTANGVVVGSNPVVTANTRVDTGSGLTGGNTLFNSITISLNANTISSLEKADSALQVSDFDNKVGLKDRINVPSDINAVGTANSSTVLAGDGTWRLISTIGDMSSGLYDPQEIRADAFARGNHTGQQPTSTITGLDNQLSNLQANVAARMSLGIYDPQLIQSDVFNRANHTGTQPVSSIDGLASVATSGSYMDLANKTAIEYDAPQVLLTDAQRGQARANIDAGIVSGFRNKIINGDFSIWQRITGETASVPTNNTFVGPDRWLFRGTALTGGTISIRKMPPDMSWRGRSRINITRTGCTSSQYIAQKIEGLEQFSGKVVTVSMDVQTDTENMSFSMTMDFGTGGNPNPVETIDAVPFTVPSGNVTRVSRIMQIPDLSTKNFGTNGDSYLLLYINFLGTANKTIRISSVSLVEGDATAEADSFSPRHIQQELALCQRYYYSTSYTASAGWLYSTAAFNDMFAGIITFPVTMRTSPTINFTDYSLSGCTLGSIVPYPDYAHIRANVNASQTRYRIAGGTFTADAEL